MADDTLTLSLDTGNGTGGDVVIKLRPDLAPGHVARITELTKDGFYDGVVFHRVIPGFMAQGGDPTGTGMSGSDKPDLKPVPRRPVLRRRHEAAKRPIQPARDQDRELCFYRVEPFAPLRPCDDPRQTDCGSLGPSRLSHAGRSRRVPMPPCRASASACSPFTTIR